MILMAGGMIAAHAVTPVSFTGSDYTQDFDTLPNSGTNPLITGLGRGPLDVPTSTEGVSLAGWSFSNPTGSGSNAVFRYDDGISNSGAVYSYGTSGATDRSLGSLASGSTVSNFGLTLVNDSGTTLTSFTLTYTGEQWRIGDAAVPNTLSFAYAFGATDLNTGTFQNVTNLDFNSPINSGPTGGSALDGNLPANQTLITYTISSILWNAGTTLTLRWTDTNDGGSDDGLAVDNLTFSAISTPVNTVVWNVTDGAWNTTSPNWTGGASTFSNGDIAQFTDAHVGTVEIDAGGVSPALVEVQNTTGTYTFNGGSLSGGGSLVKTGEGVLVLNVAMELASGLDIQAGTVKTGASDLLSDTAAVTVGSGAVLDVQDNSDMIGGLVLNGGTVKSGSAGTLTFGGNVSVQQNAVTAMIEGNLNTGSVSHTIVVADGASPIDLQIDANIVGGSRLVINGAGTTALNGDNSGFGGGITLSAGTLIAGNSNALGLGSFFFNAGTFTSPGALVVPGAVSVGGNVTIDATAGAIEFQSLSSSFGNATKVMTILGEVSITNSISGTSVINKGGAGVLTLSGANTFTTAVTVQAGTLVVSPTGSIESSPSLSVSSGATLQLENAVSLNDVITLTLVSGSIVDLDFSGVETIGILSINGSVIPVDNYTLAELQSLPGGVTFTGDIGASLEVTAVPEPSVVGLMILGVGFFVFRRFSPKGMFSRKV